jgi:hypothetical protein
MDTLLTFLAQNRAGIITLCFLIFFFLLIIQWLAWLFNLGRYANQTVDSGNDWTRHSIRFLIAEALAKIINDFRHLLALIVVSIFGLSLFYVMVKAGSSFENVLNGVQAVAAALGGLIGSIIGYYFGESAAARPLTQGQVSGDSALQEVEQDTETPPQEGDFRVAPAPPVPPPSSSTERNDHEGI